MKVGIATLANESNYGAFLQVFALCKALECLGHEAIVIDYDRESKHSVIRKYIARSPKAIVRKIKQLRYQKESAKIFIDSRSEFLNLTRKKFKYKKTKDLKELQLDCIVAGSDQIWNPKIIQRGDLDFYLLNVFPSHIRKIAYAASMGSSDIGNELKQLFKRSLETFRAVGVREKSLGTLIRRLEIEQPVEHVLDPTFLISKDQWIKYFKDHPANNKGTCFTYILNEHNIHKGNEVSRSIKEDHDLEIRWCRSPATVGTVKTAYLLRPGEFISEVRNAEYVVTDSFHGVALSINFGRRFVYIPWGEGKYYRNERVNSLVDALRIQSDLITFSNVWRPQTEAGKIYNDQVCNILKKERERSLLYLKNALSLS